MSTISPIRALISVSDKTGIAPFAQQLHALGIEILSTGGTAELLRQQHIPVEEVADYTGFPEIMDGRVKTLHPKIFAGILARRGQDDEILQKLTIQPIDLVIVNLYPFEQVTAKPDCDWATAIENIDIGGPSMVRAAAKNYAHIAIITDPEDYAVLAIELKNHGGQISAATRFRLAQKAFAYTARYEAAIANYWGKHSAEGDISLFPTTLTTQFTKQHDLRYGENPHQQAAFYRNAQPPRGSITTAQQLHGKELSFNNLADADAALECVKTLALPACVIVKHANPCGAAEAKSQLEAYRRAYVSDATSAFGGIIAFNSALLPETAQAILEQQFVEVVIAPEVSTAALALFAKKPNVRVLQTSTSDEVGFSVGDALNLRQINGGLLVQHTDNHLVSESQLKIVTQRKPTSKELDDLLFAWKIAKFVKSNAIIYVKDQVTVGIGAGQMSRIDSAQIAGIKAAAAGFNVLGAVMASDAFFPFRDSVDAAAKIGISAIIQPGGSMRDEEVILAANEAGIAMVFTGIRHFRH
ncbi:bifunctional phosphoribosylaminoimidazolecarboxamide formyltransferase/IMP cyclohydrolase [soil metagenome]